MFHPSFLFSSLQKLLSVLDALRIEVEGRFRPEGSPDRLADDMFGGTGAVRGTKSISIEVSVSVEDTCIGHRAWYNTGCNRQKLADVQPLHGNVRKREVGPVDLEIDQCARLGKLNRR